MHQRLQVATPLVGALEERYVVQCLRSGWISARGPFLKRFEEEFRRFCATRYALAVSSGTAALHVALAALGIRRGDEVLLPALTFIATANAVSYTGATPRFVDVDPVTWTIDPALAARHITQRTKALIAVHLFGHPAHLDPLRVIARRHRLALIEDACEAEGACYRGRPVGSIGDIGCFSFYGNKTLTTAEGGMIVTNDRRLRDRADMLRDHAMSPRRRYWHLIVGFNYRLTSLQAAVGVAQLQRLPRFLQQRRAVAAWYGRHLRRLPGVVLPSEAPWARHAYWMYSILVQRPFPLSREQLMRHLARQGIETRPFFEPLHRQPPYRTGERFPVAERLARQGLTLPSSSSLTARDVQRVCHAIQDIAEGRR